MTEDYGFPVLFHLLCKRENWHKIQNGNRAGKSPGGLPTIIAYQQKYWGMSRTAALRQPFCIGAANMLIGVTMMCDRRDKKQQRIGETCVKVEWLIQNRTAGVTLFAMNKITQDMRYNQAVIEYSFKHGVTNAAIRHKRIKPYTPKHNGKVERSHRKDNEEFYAIHKFYSFDDFKKQLAGRQRQ